MRRTLILAAGLSIVLGMPGRALAVEPAKPFYAVAKAGFFLPGADDLDEFDTGPAFEAAFGYRPTPNLGVEIASGFFGTNFERDTPGDSIDDTIVVIPVTIGIKGFLPAGRAEFYLQGGGGIHFVGEEIERNGVTRDDDDSSFGAYLGGGVSLLGTPQFSIGIDARYLWLETSTFGIDRSLDGTIATIAFGFRF